MGESSPQERVDQARADYVAKQAEVVRLNRLIYCHDPEHQQEQAAAWKKEKAEVALPARDAAQKALAEAEAALAAQ